MTDERRYGLIEVRQINADTYWREINGQMWSEVEWSRQRQMWCVQDAAGHCLTHVAHIVAQDRDPQAAIRLAKRMIVDGRIPSPEQARAQLKVEQEVKRNSVLKPASFGEPFTMEGVREPEPVAVRRRR